MLYLPRLHILGAYSLGAYSLERPIWDLILHLPSTCALHRMGAYSLGAYGLERPILDPMLLLPVLYKEWGPTIWGPTKSCNIN